MLVGLSTSCNEEKLDAVIKASKMTLNGYWGLTREDKEDILLDVMYRFEADKGRFPVSVYVRHCKNKVIGFLGKKTAKKRMQQKVVDGRTVYIEPLSLNRAVGEENDTELGDIIPLQDRSIEEVEFLVDLELRFPEIAHLLKKVLVGEDLTKEEKKYIKSCISKGDLLN